MLRRAALIFLLAFQSFWLAVVLPGHTRGVITVPGFKPVATAACHEERDAGAPSCCSHTGGQRARKAPVDPSRAAHCAICFFAARLSLPVAIDLRPKPLELAFVQPPPAALEAASVERLPTYLGRAPPRA
jgi:hypothetical protein